MTRFGPRIEPITSLTLGACATSYATDSGSLSLQTASIVLEAIVLLQEEFGECGRPKIGWQIDPFGHSREYANILAKVLSSLVVAKLHYNSKCLSAPFRGKRNFLLFRNRYLVLLVKIHLSISIYPIFFCSSVCQLCNISILYIWGKWDFLGSYLR